jgi:hypothetical protein
MGSLGRNVINYASGYDDSIIAGSDPEWLMVGATIDWATVAAVTGSDVTLPSGRVIKVGQKYLRHGQVLTRITATRKFGPYDPAASDGRQLLARGDIGLVERTIVLGGTLGLNESDDLHKGLVVGGHVWGGTILQAGTGTASVAAGPTLATLTTALPTLKLLYR